MEDNAYSNDAQIKIAFLTILAMVFIVPVLILIFGGMVVLIKQDTLPVSTAFILPVTFGCLYSFLYFFVRFRAVMSWSTDLGLAISALIIATASIAKGYDSNLYESISLGISGFAVAILSYVSFCATVKTFIIIYSAKEYVSKHKIKTN
ncbi:TPA: hypothetical protein ACNV46_000006 [Citrobacter freundii]|uniref:hypothetical protein n=1 Tax=Enterobacteriaceae TaxID=543 RepID=UPI0015EA1804|nr:hypothetical protein [Citrobacter freundii]EJG2198703.1 hypothetical protein [Citrobacter freundii]EKA7906018.1 hypothetical protein [Citrobacter freundii]EMA2415895.1 hypothetical protein [Citrobacter freundii]QLX62133.1 hypothetical protein HV171_03520 [Citrobacter freundii]HAT2186793.1 hypothetical protein [Citrobacter freundii]